MFMGKGARHFRRSAPQRFLLSAARIARKYCQHFRATILHLHAGHACITSHPPIPELTRLGPEVPNSCPPDALHNASPGPAGRKQTYLSNAPHAGDGVALGGLLLPLLCQHSPWRPSLKMAFELKKNKKYELSKTSVIRKAAPFQGHPSRDPYFAPCLGLRPLPRRSSCQSPWP